METLTKENFWNEMEQKYPKAMDHFKKWIDKYKEENNWKNLFNDTYIVSKTYSGAVGFSSPKYHDLPIAIQFGIFLEYAGLFNNPDSILLPLCDSWLKSPSCKMEIELYLSFKEENL